MAVDPPSPITERKTHLLPRPDDGKEDERAKAKHITCDVEKMDSTPPKNKDQFGKILFQQTLGAKHREDSFLVFSLFLARRRTQYNVWVLQDKTNWRPWRRETAVKEKWLLVFFIRQDTFEYTKYLEHLNHHLCNMLKTTTGRMKTRKWVSKSFSRDYPAIKMTIKRITV